MLGTPPARPLRHRSPLGAKTKSTMIMRDFFNGWRRKSGCVVLLVACVVMAGWIRSRYLFENVDIVIDDQSFVTLFSCMHGVGCSKSHYRELKLPASMRSPRYWTTEQPSNIVDGEGNDLTQNLFVIWVDDADSDPESQFVIVRYFVIAVPLTLLSALLILWPRRKQKPAGGQPDA